MSLADEIRTKVPALAGLGDCHQCQKCTSACPIVGVPDAFDVLPHQIFRLVDTDRRDAALNNSTIWMCTSCGMCSARCPVGIDVTRLIEVLRRIAFREGRTAKEPRIISFHRIFLESVKSRGRLGEFGALWQYKKEQGELFKDFGLGFAMLRKGKLRLSASKCAAGAFVSAIVGIGP